MLGLRKRPRDRRRLVYRQPTAAEIAAMPFDEPARLREPEPDTHLPIIKPHPRPLGRKKPSFKTRFGRSSIVGNPDAKAGEVCGFYGCDGHDQQSGRVLHGLRQMRQRRGADPAMSAQALLERLDRAERLRAEATARGEMWAPRGGAELIVQSMAKHARGRDTDGTPYPPDLLDRWASIEASMIEKYGRPRASWLRKALRRELAFLERISRDYSGVDF